MGGYLCKRLPAMTNRKVGERIDFPGTVCIAGRTYTSAIVERDFKTANNARLLRFVPGNTHFVFKLGNMQQEVAVMCALKSMNQRWRSKGIRACGAFVEAVTYNIIPLGTEAGLIEAVAR